MFTAEEEQGKISTETGSVTQLQPSPPLSLFASERGLVNTHWTQQSVVEQKIDLVKWSQRPDVKAAWQRLASRENLEPEAFEQATWRFLGFVLGRKYDLVISMNKARKAGWAGWEDTWESLSKSLDELANKKVLPRFRERTGSFTRTTSDVQLVRAMRARVD